MSIHSIQGINHFIGAFPVPTAMHRTTNVFAAMTCKKISKDHGKRSALKKLKQSNLKLKAKKQVVFALGSIPTYLQAKYANLRWLVFFPRSNAKTAKILSVYRGGEDDSLNADENWNSTHLSVFHKIFQLIKRYHHQTPSQYKQTDVILKIKQTLC